MTADDNKLRQVLADRKRNYRDWGAKIVDGVTYAWKPGNVARTSMASIESHQNSFSPFSTSDDGSDADSATPGDLTLETESTSPEFNAEQMRVLDISSPPQKHVETLWPCHALPQHHVEPFQPCPDPRMCATRARVDFSPRVTNDTKGAAPRRPSQTKTQIKTAKRLQEQEERERGRRVKEIYLKVMYGGNQAQPKTASSTPLPPKPAAKQSPCPQTRLQTTSPFTP